MKLRLVLAPLLLASVAHAQAPGEADLAPPGMAPAVLAAPVAVERVRRFSVGVGIGGTELAPHSAPEDTTSYSLAQIAVRYLATRHLEVELAVSGGREELQSGEWGLNVQHQAVLGLRWRFNPQCRWNWWLMAGMGSLAITGPDATKAEREASSQSTLQFGAGLERRFRRFALQAELRAVGVAPNDTKDMPAILPPGPTGMNPAANDPYVGKKGTQFAISANYYF